MLLSPLLTPGLSLLHMYPHIHVITLTSDTAGTGGGEKGTSGCWNTALVIHVYRAMQLLSVHMQLLLRVLFTDTL